jgi:hypothetical protein
MVAGKLHTVDQLLAPFSTAATEPVTTRAAGSAPVPLTAKQAHAHHDEFWWHEPEWLHRVCCEG